MLNTNPLNHLQYTYTNRMECMLWKPWRRYGAAQSIYSWFWHLFDTSEQFSRCTLSSRSKRRMSSTLHSHACPFRGENIQKFNLNCYNVSIDVVPLAPEYHCSHTLPKPTVYRSAHYEWITLFVAFYICKRTPWVAHILNTASKAP